MPKKEQALSVIDVTRSYARKLNMSAHGGKQYETADVFASLTAKDIPLADAKKVSDQLYQQCVAEVEGAIDALDSEQEELEKEVAPKPKKTKATKGEVELEQEELEEISKYINDLTLAKTKTELGEAAKQIKKDSARFSDAQKKYLALYYKKKVDAIE